MSGFVVYDTTPAYEIVVTEDHGGYVDRYEKAVETYNAQGNRVEIRGICNSACTLALAVKNVCVGEGAYVKWHQAYEPNTQRLRPDVTRRMLSGLPSSLRNYLNGKIQRDYTQETSLHFEQLVSLGIPDCDSPSYKATVVAAKVNYKTSAPTPANIASSTPPADINYQSSPEEQKEMDWAKYWEWAGNQSKSQFGKIKVRKFNLGKGNTSTNVYYWDKNGMYVTAIQYYKDDMPGERKVCRATEVQADEMTCTIWSTGATIYLEYDDFTEKYEIVRR
jgi:hypothetical protein